MALPTSGSVSLGTLKTGAYNLFPLKPLLSSDEGVFYLLKSSSSKNTTSA